MGGFRNKHFGGHRGHRHHRREISPVQRVYVQQSGSATMKINWAGSWITGSKDAIFIKNFYEPQLKRLDDETKVDGWKIEHTFEELSRLFYKKQSLMRDIEAHEIKRSNAYEQLSNILKNEENFEGFMHKETTGTYKEISKNQFAKDIKINQRMHNSDNEIKFGGILKYIEKYPEYQTKSTIRDIISQIKHEENELKDIKKDHNHSMANYDPIFTEMMILFKKSEEKIKRFNELFEKANMELKECRFNRWGIYKLVSAEKQAATKIDDRDFRTPMFAQRIAEIKTYLSEYTPKKFIESEYENSL
jgi:hypothetical protein